MTVAHDASTESATFTTTTPHTFSHTPVGTPRAVIVAIAHGNSTNFINGAVTYGGVAMTRIGTAIDSATEAGRSYLYFLGASIPTGTQTVSISHTGAADVKWAVCHTMTAAADTTITHVESANENRTSNPALVTSYLSALRVGVLYSGNAAPSDITLGSGLSAVQDHDFGAFIARYDRETTASTGEFAWTRSSATADDWAEVIAAIAEVPSSSTALAVDTVTHYGYFTTAPDPYTFTHTPINTPRGVLVFPYSMLGISGSGDFITGNVTYGGVTMTEVVTATDTTTEPGRVYAYFLGSSVPTGAQTVSIDHDAGAEQKGAIVVTLTGPSDLAVGASATDGENQANPQAALDSGAENALRFAFIASGLATASSLTQVGTTDRLVIGEFINNCIVLDVEPAIGSGSVTVGWTSGADDVAAVYIAIEATASPVTDLYVEATETDAAMPFSADTQILDLYAHASETDAAMPFLAATNKTDEYAFAAEADTAMPFTATLTVTDLYAHASETDAAMPFSADTAQTDDYGFASETDAAMPFSADTNQTDDYGFAAETDAAMPFSADTNILDEFAFATETDAAMPFVAAADQGIEFDAATDLGTATTGALTGTHTPVGDPAGVIVKIAHGTETTDLITGVTYGGVPMTRTGFAIDDAGEPGRVYIYFLGSGIPTGPQTVTVSHTGTATVKWANVESYTAAEDTTVVATWRGDNMGAQDDLYSADIYTAQPALRTGVVYSGFPNVGDLTMLTGMTAVNSVDFVAFIARADRETDASVGNFDYGYTAAGVDDFASHAVALAGVSTVPTTPLAVTSTHVYTWSNITDPSFGVFTSDDTAGAIMFVGMYGTPLATDFFTSATYGADAFTEYAHAADTTGEQGHSYGLYVTNISGSDTVSMVATANTIPYMAYVFGIASGVTLIDSGQDDETQANPQDALDSGAEDAIRFGFIFSGLATAASLTPVGLPDTILNVDGVNTTNTRLDADLTPTSGNITVGWTSASDDVAAVYGAFAEGDVLDSFELANETDQAMPFSADTTVIDEFAFATETDSAMPFTADTAQTDDYGFAGETDEAMPFETTLGVQDVIDLYVEANETDTAMPFTAEAVSADVLDEFTQVAETDVAMPFSAVTEDAPPDEESPGESPGDESPGDVNVGFAQPHPIVAAREWSVWHADRFGNLREPLPWVSFAGGPLRIVDAVSSISVNLRDEADLVRRIKPWGSEIQLRYGELIMWAGPVTEISYEYSADNGAPVNISASDLLHWLSVRLLRTPIDPAKVSIQFQQILERAMAGDNVGLEVSIPQPVGIMGDELATEITDALAEIQALAPYLDFTMFGRELKVGKEEIPFGTLPNLILPEHASSFTLTHNGDEEASQIYIRGGDDFRDDFHERQRVVFHYPGRADREDPDIGLVQRLISDSDIINDTLASRTAQSRYEFGKPPLWVAEVTLAPRSPFPIEELVAGSRVDVDYPAVGIYGERMRVRSVSVDVGPEAETVSIELIPLGIFAGQFVASVL